MAATPSKTRNTKGDGSVRPILTASGKKAWRAALRYHDHAGTPVYASRTVATEAEAKHALKTFLAARAAGLKAPRRTYRVRDLMAEWLEGKRADVAAGKLSTATFVQYQYAVSRIVDGVGEGDDALKGLGTLEASRLHPEAVQGFLDRARQVYSPRTAALFRTALFGACKRAVRLRQLASNPVASTDSVRLTKRADHGVRAMTPEQAAKFLHHVEGDDLRALWALYVSLGLRRGEALGLKWSDYDRATGTLSIRRNRKKEGKAVVVGELKTAASVRDLPVGPGLAAILEAHRQRQLVERAEWLGKGERAEGEWIFTMGPGHPLDPDWVSWRFKVLAAEAGIGTWHLHECRHTAITLALKGGMPFEQVKKFAGHSSVRVTIDTYSHLASEDLRAGVDVLDALLHSSRS
ncbi:MAG: site-specific integrase [Actinomycetota bacterium]|nr:site-specific integrase [Actinomycetota bacterium]